MHTSNFDQSLDLILRKDSRYHREAYHFVREALDHTQKLVTKAGREGAKGDVRHVSGQELLAGIRAYALEQFGPMTVTVFEEWGIHRSEDFGEIVFNMVENNLLSANPEDTRDDFKSGYNFDEAFRQPFLPSAKNPPLESRPKSTRV